MIHHFYARQSGKASEVISRALSLRPDQVAERIVLGALYVRRRRCLSDENVLEGDYIRFHENPKRFTVGFVDWEKRIVAHEEDFLIVDKPAGLPTHQTLDNVIDNLRHQLSQFIGSELFTTHRLDQPTSGLLLFAKNSKFQKRFNLWLEKGKVTKRYLARCEKPLPLGLYTHYMMWSKRVPKQILAHAVEGAVECRLEVESCQKNLEATYDIRVRIFTGRTHQIRAQFAFLGAPILGDTLYGSSQLRPNNSIALSAIELGFEGRIFRLSAAS